MYAWQVRQRPRTPRRAPTTSQQRAVQRREVDAARPLRTPSTMMLVAWPRILGPSTVQRHARRPPARRPTMTPQPLGAQSAEQAPGRASLKSFDRSARHAGGRQPPPSAGRSRASAIASRSGVDRRRRSSACGRCRCRPIAVAHAASSALSLRRHDLGVGRAGLEQLVVRAEPDLRGRPRARGSGRRWRSSTPAGRR